MREKENPPPDHLRCKRTDGRQWRCKRFAMEGKTLCDIHHLQGKHRQNKEKVPDSLKLERTVTKKKKTPSPAPAPVTEEKKRRRFESEKLDEVLKRMKLKNGDLHLELIRGFLKRKVEKKREKDNVVVVVEEERRVLPYGVMAISRSNLNVESDGLDLKLGVGSDGNTILERHFRSKNIEPLPISTMQVVPFAENVRKKKLKKCHWCRESKVRGLIKCLNCRIRFFCLDCIKERYFEKQEVKVRCPACRGTCSCKLCLRQQSRANNPSGERKDLRIQLLHYLIYTLLPVLKKINCDQTIELQTEAKLTGQEQSKIQISQAKSDIHTSQCCNKCKSSIVDYHRTCTNCSYNLCLSCCLELSQHSSQQRFGLKSCRNRKIHSSGDEPLFRQNTARQISLQNWKTCEDGTILCPPTDIGGCGDSVLDLRCIFPFNWTRDLEVRSEQLLCSYHFPETADVSSCCSLCNEISTKDGELQRELSRRIGFNEKYLYCPTAKDLQQESLEHFQNHWGKGHPVIVRNVLRNTTSLCWDPVSMFCSYMEEKSSESCNEDGMKASNSLDWCEVEIHRKRIFMGSLEKRTHASMHQKVLKFKTWLSSHLFQKQFPLHYNEIISALPLPEYINPVSGLLNVGVKLPKELQKPDLGPCISFSYGSPEELMQADNLSKLCYESHDTVNILAYATDAPVSPEQIGNIENLMKKYKAGKSSHVQSSSNSNDQKGKSSLQSEDTGESSLQDIEEKIHLPNGIEKSPFYPGGQIPSVENGNLFDDSESDAEASILCSGSVEDSEDSDEYFQKEDMESSCSSEDKRETNSCGAQWDIFCRQDVPKLLEYLKKHANELSLASSCSKHVHPILDQNFYLDAYHKLKLKEEFHIQPWTFEQCRGEAIFIPAGCPYQVRKIKSCVNVVVDFISPEDAAHCIQLNDEIRLLPTRHKAKRKLMEVEKMALEGIRAAIEDICNLMPVKQE